MSDAIELLEYVMSEFVEGLLGPGRDIIAIYQDEAGAAGYDQRAEMFGKNPNQYAASIDQLLSLTTHQPDEVVVDLGCGTAISTQRIRAANPTAKIIAVDPSEAMLAYARDKLKQDKTVEFLVASAEELSEVVQGVDKVVSVGVFEMFRNRNNALQQIYQVLNPGGEYLFNVPVLSSGSGWISLYTYLPGILCEALGEEPGEEPDERIRLAAMALVFAFEPIIRQSNIQEWSQENGFGVKQYKELPYIYGKQFLEGELVRPLDRIYSPLVEKRGEAEAERVLQRMMEIFSIKYFADTIGQMKAYVCLEKV